MRSPFVVRVEAGDDQQARRLARELEETLAERAAVARVESARRTRPGASAAVGVLDAAAGPRWIEPFELPADDARGALVAFLEQWGFIGAARRAAP